MEIVVMYSNKAKWISRFLLTWTMFFSLTALSEGALQSQMQAFVVLPQADGSETFEVAKAVEPGQVIEYRTMFSNTGDTAISGLAVVGPVPSGTRYLGNSATSDVTHAFEASIDNGNSWHSEPLMRKVTQADGSETEEVVPPEDYTHVRWKATESIASNGNQEYRYRVFVLPTEGNVK
jgi:uncharacterized repeat protein (TIGR01451 family)